MTTNTILLIVFSFAILLAIITIAIIKLATRGKYLKSKSSSFTRYMNEQIYVGNLPYRMDESDLQGYFSRFGGIQTVKIIRNFKTGRSKGYAFVTYQSAKQAAKALAAHGRDLGGRSLVVRIAKPREEQPAY